MSLQFFEGIYSKNYIFISTTYFLCFVLGYASQVSNNPMLIYSTAKEIRLINSSRPKSKPYIIVQNYTFIASVDYHYEKKKIFWVDQHIESIFSIDYKNNYAENKVRCKLFNDNKNNSL